MEDKTAERVQQYFTEEGIADNYKLSFTDLKDEVAKCVDAKTQDEIWEGTKHDRMGNDGQARFYDSLSQTIGKLSIYDFCKSRHYESVVWRLSEVYTLLAERNVKNVLDVGCANGLEACFLAEEIKDSKVTGIDVSSQMIELANKRAAKRKIKNANFIVADRDKIPFAEGSFDSVFYMHSLAEGTEKDLINFNAIFNDILIQRLKEARRVLTDNGILLVLRPSCLELNVPFRFENMERIVSAGFSVETAYWKDFSNNESTVVVVAKKSS